MKHQQCSCASFLCIIAGLFFLATPIIHAQASYAEGIWTWSTPGRNGGPDRTNTLTLKIEGSKLSGKVAAPGRGGQVAETAIAEGKIEGAENVSFVVVREFNGNSVTNKYSGKISGNKITGKIEFTRDGEAQSRNWEASRLTDAK
jgi:hypothetical protein